jgi:hypothetical protein
MYTLVRKINLFEHVTLGLPEQIPLICLLSHLYALVSGSHLMGRCVSSDRKLYFM